MHFDIWRSYRLPSSYGAHYFLTIIDDTNGATCAYLIRDRTETNNLHKGFIAMVKTQFQRSIMIVRSDNGSEFTSGPMQRFYQLHGFITGKVASLICPNKMEECSETLAYFECG